MKITKSRLREIIREEIQEMYDHPFLQHVEDDPVSRATSLHAKDQERKERTRAAQGTDPLAGGRFKKAADQSVAEKVARELNKQLPRSNGSWTVVAVTEPGGEIDGVQLRISNNFSNNQRLAWKEHDTLDNILSAIDYTGMDNAMMMAGGISHGFSTHFGI